MNKLIQRMQQSAEGQVELGENELRLIQTSAGRIANSMVGDHHMERFEALRIWQHVQQVAENKGIEITIPTIPDTQQLTPEVLNGSMTGNDTWAGSTKSKDRDPARWL